MKSSREKVSTDRIRYDPDLQCRHKVSETTIREYAGLMNQGVEFPDPSCHGVEGNFLSPIFIGDGWHRLKAAELRGQTEVYVQLSLHATLEDAREAALLEALGTNIAHGLRRTNADKRRACYLALQNWSAWTDSKIAEVVGVDHKTVASVRRKMAEQGELDASEKRTGKDGKRRAPRKKSTNLGNSQVDKTVSLVSDPRKIPEVIQDLDDNLAAFCKRCANYVDFLHKLSKQPEVTPSEIEQLEVINNTVEYLKKGNILGS